ncbi:hypothetical protein PR202_gb24164 [Eleusine coracana subsp. coracana]|uniref:Uncharacterized protein n=1 Tax=Eleusine coracana subsp. coracana TaxID=191504 RepID=A0AAV5FKS4_ELECO|nr:hypothetical protein PR202_gb24164 [Eleusine coracana subsp. coracana]
MALAPSHLALQAAVDGNLRLLKEMAKKMDLRVVKDDNRKTLLHLAAAKGHFEFCKLMIEEWGLDVNSLTTEGESTTLMAAFSGSIPVLQYLIDRGGDPGMATSRGSTPLHEAAEHGHCEAARLLLSKGVPVDPLNHRGTPLHLAVAKDQDETAKILLEHGADPNRVIHHVFSPLVMACCAASLKCMKLLVEAGANVNFKSSFGPSALMMAVDDGLTDIVKYLLEVGADPNIPDHHGRIPIMCAGHFGQRDLVEILFPRTKPIPSIPYWSVDGIIETMKYMPLDAQDAVSVEEHIADAKSRGKEAFAKGEYLAAIYFYGLNYEGATDAFMEALKLDPESDEIKKALRQCPCFHSLSLII